MARTSLPPGFRFHPTDVELVLYYLKRKVMGKKLHFEAIAEVNIYKFSPWDLPDLSCLKSKDLEWYFFCPRKKKYASGARFNRATENGYWKTTGKDRPIRSDEKTVGTVKTLVFHSGPAPRGERTDWVIHEYRILDDQLAAAGVQDTYVLCKVFKKNGLGPKYGAQYGAPFKEEDWVDDDISDAQTRATPLTSDGPSPTSPRLLEEQACTPVTDLFYPGSTSGLPLTEGPSLSVGRSTSDLLLDETNDEITRPLAPFTDDDGVGDAQILATPLAFDVPSPTMLAPLEKQACPHVKGLVFPGSMSGFPLTEGPSSSAGHSISQVLLDETDDEMTRLLASFTDDDNLFVDMNGINLDDLNDKMNESLPFSDVYDIHGGLGDWDKESQMNEDGLDFSGMQKDAYSMNMFPQYDLADVELDDLLVPSNCSARVSGTDQSAVLEVVGSCNNENAHQLHSGVCFAGVDQYASCENQLPTLPEESYSGENCLDALQKFNDQLYQGCNAANVFGFAHEQLESGIKFTKDWKIGTQNFLYMSRLMESIPVWSPSAAEHLALSFSLCGGSSMHIKAEVTHRAGECTNEALFSMMGGSGSCWCNLPLAVPPGIRLWVRNPLSCFVDLFFLVALVYCYLNYAVCFMELNHLYLDEKIFCLLDQTKW